MIALLLGCPAPDPEPPTPVPPQALDAASLEEVTRSITDLGARLVATPAERDGEDLVEALFLEAGLQLVAREPFAWDAWVPGPASIALGDEVFPAEALSPTPPTAGLTAPLIREGTGDPAGRVVVATDVGTSRGVQAVAAAIDGASALIRVTEATDDDGGPLVEVGHTLAGLTLPAFAVDRATGDRLRDAIGQEVTLSAETAELVGHVSHNVVGVVPGTGSRTVIVTAHVDSWHPSESAADNAIGVAAMILLARRLADGPTPEATVTFVATGAEEQGLQGALAYVGAHPEEARRADLVLNLDVLWASEGTFLVMADEPELLGFALDAAEREGLSAVDAGAPNPSSDQFPFQIAGAPTFWSGRFGYRGYHTAIDTVDTLDFEDAARALRVQWAVLAREAGVP